MAPKDTRTYQQIEATAGLYGPAVYAGLEERLQGLLSHFHDLELNVDVDGFGYTPATSVKLNPREAKLFAVGVIPPTANVTGRLLDRSATIAEDTSFVPPPITPVTRNNRTGTSNNITGPKTGWGSKVATLSDEFWDNFVGMCRRLDIEPEEWAAIVYNESGFDPTAANYGKPGSKDARKRQEENNPIAVGLNQFIWSAGRLTGMTREEFEEHAELSAEDQLYWMETYLNRVGMRGRKRGALYRRHFGGVPGNPEPDMLYASHKYQDQYISWQVAAGKLTEEEAKQPGIRSRFFPRSNFQNRAYFLNPFDTDKAGFISQRDLDRKVASLPPQLVKFKLAAAEARLGDFVGEPPIKPGTEEAAARDNWVEGSGDASVSRKEQQKRDRVPLNQRDLGKAFQTAQRRAALEAKAAIDRMKNTPPLRLLVNPKQFDVKGAKIILDGNWSRRGAIIEHWGDEQDIISATGRVAAFYTRETGVTRTARQFSEAWRNLQSLYLLYKNNGGVYLQDPFDPTGKTSRLTYVGSIYIYYDGILYIGSFTNFSISEDETTPFTAEYSFEFQVRAAFLLDQPDDRYNLQYSYQADNQEEPKPPLPTKTTVTDPPDQSTTPAEAARFTASIEERDRRRAEQSEQAQEDVLNSTLTSDGTLVVTDADGNVARTVGS